MGRGGARRGCGNVRWRWGVWEGVVEQEVTEEFDKEGSGTNRGWRWSGRRWTQERATRSEALRRRMGRGGE